MSEIINKQAQRWLELMLSDKVTFAEQQQFLTWIEQSPEHQKSYFCYRTAFFKKQKQRKLHKRMLCGLVASVFFVLAGLHVFMPQQSLPQEYITQASQKTYTLPDGSLIELKPHTRLTALYSDDARLIKLLDGDAYFHVAKDSSRPFVVQYKDMNVTALGTKFYVRTHSYVQVQVTEHSVKVTSKRNEPLVLQEGEGRRLIKEVWQPLSTLEFKSGLLWRDKLLEFYAEPLSAVLSELELYHGKTIEVVNSAILNEKISGRFQVASQGDVELAISMLADGLDLKVKHMSDGDILLY